MEPETSSTAAPGARSQDAIEIMVLHDEDMMFAVRNGRGECLSKSGEWVPEPIPSNRTAQFVSRCRFDDYRQAASVLAKALSGSLTFEQLEEMANVLNNLADDLLESGIEEWDSLDDAIQSTVNNARDNLYTELIAQANRSSIFTKT